MDQSTLLSSMADHVTVNLHILASLRPGDKLRVAGDVVEVDPPSRARCVRRFLRKDGRHISVITVERWVATARRLLRTTPESDAKKNLRDAMHAAIAGIQNLRQTYAADAAVCARLTVAACRIEDALN